MIGGFSHIRDQDSGGDFAFSHSKVMPFSALSVRNRGKEHAPFIHGHIGFV